jgi:hypothetical protein
MTTTFGTAVKEITYRELAETVLSQPGMAISFAVHPDDSLERNAWPWYHISCLRVFDQFRVWIDQAELAFTPIAFPILYTEGEFWECGSDSDMISELSVHLQSAFSVLNPRRDKVYVEDPERRSEIRVLHSWA